MNRLLPALCASLVMSSAQAMSAAEVYAQVSPSVWRVQTYDGDGLPLGQGSGVVVGTDTLVTNCHVLAKAKRVAVRRDKVSIDAKLDMWDVQRDLCQLRAPGLSGAAIRLAESGRVVVGQKAFAIGNPRGLDLTMSEGLVSAVRKNDAGQIMLIQTSAAISGGSSGGGLFDENGALIGLTTLASRTDLNLQNLNFAIPADWVRDLPQRHARLNTKPPVTTAAPTTPAAPTAATPSGAARIDDTSALPYASDEMRARYTVFLTRPLPRAFVISEGGDWSQSWGKPGSDASTPAERAMRECEKAKRGRCFVYAIDDRVVYVPESGTGR